MADKSLSKQNWPVVAFAFTFLLVCITLGSWQTFRYTNRIDAKIQSILREQEESDRILDELRIQTFSVVVELRDYLLAPAPESDHSQRRIAKLKQSMYANAQRLESEHGQHIRGGIPNLLRVLDRYWQSVGPIFAWTPSQRKEHGAAFLQKNVVPNRGPVLDTTSEIEAMHSLALQGEREALARAQRSFRRFLLTDLWILLAFGSAVTFLTSYRLRLLEQRSRSLQLQTEQDRHNLRELSSQLVTAQEEERRSLSRELHDQVGQMLTAIQLQLSKIEAAQDSPFDRNRYLAEGKSLVDQTAREVSDLAMGLRPAILDDLGLASALEWQAREFSRQSGIRVNLNMDRELSELPDAPRTCLYRVVQEALTNCARHAEAKQVRISLQGGTDQIVLTIQDDGRGFDPEQMTAAGLGLIGIEERVRKLGGTVRIRSRVGEGTRLKVEIPSSSEVHA